MEAVQEGVFRINDGVEENGHKFQYHFDMKRMKTLLTALKTLGGRHET